MYHRALAYLQATGCIEARAVQTQLPIIQGEYDG